MGPLFGIVPPQACLVFKPGDHRAERESGPHILFLKSQCHLTLAATRTEDVGP